ncbi:MAG: PP2C family protein-serine/threonine phosphatase [Planctomycetaceae bacterium]
MPELLQDALLAIDERMTEPQEIAVPGGIAGVFSSRSPAKETANEDAAAVIPAGDAVVLAVADGVGGCQAGEQASRIALQSLKAAIDEALLLDDPLSVMIVAEPPSQAIGTDDRPPWLRTAILNGLERANREILALGTGAATTVAVAEISGNSVRTYHVGDSMILLVGGRGKIKAQTISHSPVGYGIEAGLLDEAEAMHHEDRHLVSNFVGCPEMRIEIGPSQELSARDTLLLASDGLADNLHTQEIIERIRSGPLLRGMLALAKDSTSRMLNPAEGQPSKPDDLTFVVYRPRMPNNAA